MAEVPRMELRCSVCTLLLEYVGHRRPCSSSGTTSRNIVGSKCIRALQKQDYGREGRTAVSLNARPGKCACYFADIRDAPHLAGSTEDFSDAKDILAVFQKNFGIHPPSEAPIFAAGSAASRGATLGVNRLTKPAAWIDIYYPVLNTPLDRSLSILNDDGTETWTADLVEDGDPADPEAAKYRDYVPTFHGLSHDGDVEGQLIYANYGRKEDFDEILAAGGNFTGKIVLVRYGRNFRGLKVSGAEDLGALGVLIYSDPRDDGSVTISNGYAPYPEGPARNPTSVQRGSVQYLSIYPGDPTTPGAPAYPNATRTEGKNIPYIPSLPISWANAQRLLEEIAQGGLGESQILDGRTSARKIRLVNHVDTKVTPIWNTMAAIPGHIKNETVVIGCHRDAWVMGAADPTSGTVSLHEVIRGFGALLKSGWRPLRNVVFASWDAEEYGLIGSTEWTEDFPEWISQHVVAYINVDVSVAGSRWHSGASPSLAHLIRQAALEVPHPTAAGNEFLASYELEGTHASDVGIYPLGSGSDYTPFLQRLGVASMDQGFSGTPTDAPYHYHSVYDSQRWQELYADPGFYRHVAVAKHLGLVALRVADAIILPLNTTQYALELDYYLDKVESIASELFVSADFSALRRSIAHLQTASKDLDAEKAKAEAKFRKLLKKLPHRRESCRARKSSLPGWLRKLLKILHVHRPRGFPIRKFIKAANRVQAVNAKLIAFERGFISEEGLKDREWYRHLAVAPGKWLGYGATTLPSITEALTIDKNVTLAKLEAVRVTKLVENLSQVLAVYRSEQVRTCANGRGIKLLRALTDLHRLAFQTVGHT
ncbi:Glutamate carboxypeptidase 2 [Grifola frondosa]|uniref:Glutamate carboxypeptidase 2 n=1 Tax=Grifola frondosa TaxID=5627 RepID=A0A1C7MJC1_GRIFR|nr:Glutamate carboxypeptidase 2 [Grifola frondosa]